MPPPWYKWVILVSACVSTFASYGYVSASTSILTIYSIQRYNERFISGLIGPAQMSLQKMTCLPMLYLNKKLGNRVQQIIGGVLIAASTALTSLTTSSWQGLLLSGVCAGIGSGMLHITTTNIIKEYFPGRQLGPFGAMSLTINMTTIVIPQLWKFLITTLDWQKTLITIGGMLSVNIICGLTYAKLDDKPSNISQTSTERKPLITLLPRSSSSAVYIIEKDIIDDDNNTKTRIDLKLEESDEDENSIKPEEHVDSGDNSENEGQSNIENVCGSMWATIKQPQSIALVIMSGLYAGGIISGLTVIGDYGEQALNLTDKQVANAISIQGALQIVSAVVYIFLTACTEFSSVLLHTVSMLGLSCAMLAVTFISSEVEFCILVAIIGFFKSFTTGNAVPLSIELVGSEQALKLYVVKCLVDGIGVAAMPFIAVYIQETVNERAALYLSSAALFCSGSVFFPFLKRFFLKSKIKSTNDMEKHVITITSYVNYE